MHRLKRFFDASIALALILVTSPLLLIGAIGIKLSNPGPVFYRAKRIGRDRRRQRRSEPYRGREFTMYKFRTMRADANGSSAPLTQWKDSRVFPWGRVLRATKVDELPQLINVVKGDMALVGPRPEAPEIVRSHYGPDEIDTLQVPPGVTSPGTIYYYTHCEDMLQGEGVADVYAHRLLPLKLALDRVYLKKSTFGYDLRLLLRTFRVIVARTFGIRRFVDPPELSQANVGGASRAKPWEN
jgi:lipopolysaccharide/colanic/teichoic acid biosynthesis glycosyltransferase